MAKNQDFLTVANPQIRSMAKSTVVIGTAMLSSFRPQELL
jgi:hypothetical protein